MDDADRNVASDSSDLLELDRGIEIERHAPDLQKTCERRATLRASQPGRRSTAGLQEEQLGAVIDRIYEAATQPDLWRTVLHEASLACGAECAALVPSSLSGMSPVWSEGADELADCFLKKVGDLGNARAERGAARRSQGIMTEAMLFSREELDHHPFNAELMNPLGFRWFAGAHIARVGQGWINFSVDRLARHGPFSPRELDVVEMMLPHLRRALQMTLRVGLTRAEGMLDAFEQIGCGGVLLDALGSVVRLNAKAQRHLGAGLLLAQNHLLAEHRDANAGLQRLIASVLQPGPAHEAAAMGAVAVPRPIGRPLIMHAAPIVGSARDIFQHVKAILMLVDPDEHREPGEFILRQAFGLTPAEVQLALGLARGHDLKEIAEARGVSAGTARYQLKAIFAKTGTGRQAELVALLSRMARIR